MVYDEKGNEAFDRMPIADTMEELLDGQLEDSQVAELIDNNIEAYAKEVEKLNEKKPKKTTSRAELIAATNKLKADRAEAERKLKYWQDVKAELAKITHTTEEEMTALSEAENEAREETVAETESQPAENTTEEEGETEAVPQSTTTDAKEPFRARAREWSEKTGVDVVLLESIDDVESDYVRNQIIAAEKNNQQVKGWYDDGSGRVFIYMPHAESEADVEATFVHEVVSHKGLRELLGNAAFDTLCDNVFEMMSPETQAKFLDYVGAEDINNPTEAEKRAAADEYIAHLAEKTDLTDAEKSVWDNIVKMIRTALETLGLSISINDDVLSNLIKASYAEMVKNSRSEDTQTERIVSGVNADTLTLAMSQEEFENLLTNGSIEDLRDYARLMNDSLALDNGLWNG